MLGLREGKAELEILLHILFSGEQLAYSVSRQQSLLLKKTQPKIAKFLGAQSSQEKFHARMFQAAMLWLNPKSGLSQKKHPIFNRLEKMLKESLVQNSGAGCCANESIIGLHIIIETLGEQALEDLDTQLSQYRFGLRRIRHVVLHQERAHHAFGERYLIQQNLLGPKKEVLREKCDVYIEQVDLLFRELAPIFNQFELNQQSYMKAVQASMSNVFDPAFST